MTSFHVKGGTNAGWRTVRVPVKVDWKCPTCTALNKYYWRNCPTCGTPRPE